MLEETIRDVPIKRILNAFESASNAEEGKQDIFLSFNKKYRRKDEKTEKKTSTSPDSFLTAKRMIEKKLSKGYVLQMASVDLMKFDGALCHMTLSRNISGNTYNLREDFNHEPTECTTSCYCDSVCKAFYKALTKDTKKA